MNKITMPAGARYIIEQLNNHGFEAYIVGGCVRDSLLGKYPNDWDITTSATPYEVKDIFDRTIDTGIQHGTVTVLVGKDISNGDEYAFEVTTYRIDGEYTDHRRPDKVQFTVSLEEDLKRRDFTINAMAYNDEQGIIDIFGGIKDLEGGIVRCVGNPTHRFDEDALRILRAVRFAAQLGFEIDEPTKQAMAAQAKFLNDISAERIQVELTKLITSKHPDRLREAYELGITAIVLPEFDAMMKCSQNNPYHKYTVGEHTIKVMEAIPNVSSLRYAALLHDVAKPLTKVTDNNGIDHFRNHPSIGADMAKKVLRRLKLDNNTIDKVTLLVANHDYGMGGIGAKAFRKFLSRLGKENFADFMEIKKADIKGQSDYKLSDREAVLASMEQYYQEIQEKNQCLSIKDLAIDGNYLIKEMDIKPGPELGRILKTLLEKVLDDPEVNTVETLSTIAQDIK